MSLGQLQLLRTRTSLFLISGAVAAVLFSSSCSSKKDAGPVAPTTPAAPTAQLANATIAIAGLGNDGTLTLTVSPATATVAWRSENATIATVSGTTATATVHAVAAGTARIVATVTSGTLSIEAAAQVTVTAIVRSVTIAPVRDSVPQNTTKTFVATVVADSGLAKAVSWRSSNTGVATVSVTGVATGVTTGTVTITALSTADTTVRGTAILSVLGPVFPMMWTETNDARFGTLPLAQMRGITMRQDSVVIAVGDDGGIALRSPSGTWATETSPVNVQLLDVSAPSTDLAWAVGANGTILRRTATVSGHAGTGTGTWVAEPSGTTTRLIRIVMNADGTGYAMDSFGLLLERSGGAWRPASLPTTPGFALNDISLSGNTLFAAGGQALQKRTNGVWTKIDAPVDGGVNNIPPVSNVVALSESDALVTGQSHDGDFAAWRVSGSTWTRERGGDYVGISNVRACVDGSVMGLHFGSAMAHVGSTWAVRAEAGESTSNTGGIGAVACLSASTWSFIGEQALGSVRGGVATWEQFRPNLQRLSVGNASTAFATWTSASQVVRWDGTSWRVLGIPNPSDNYRHDPQHGPAIAAFSSGAAKAASNSWAGDFGGAAWSWHAEELNQVSMWGSSQTDIWAAGIGSAFEFGSYTQLQHFNGVAWSNAVPKSFVPSLVGVHGVGTNAMFAVGDATAVRLAPDGIKIDVLAGSPSLLDVVVFSATSAVVVGNQGKAFRFDGTQWVAIPVSTTEALLAVTGTAPTDVYAFGDKGSLFNWNGTQWTFVKKFSRVVRAARTVGSFALAVGDDGTVVYGRATARR